MKVLTIALTGVRLAFRDRSTIFFTIIFPFVIIFIIGTATAGFSEQAAPIGLVDESDDAMSKELATLIDRSPLVDVERVENAEELRSLLRRGAYVAGVVVEPDYRDALRRGATSEIQFLTDRGRGFPAAVRAAVSSAVAEQGQLAQAARFAMKRAGGTYDESLAEARKTKELLPAIGINKDELGERPTTRFLMSGFEYTAPSNLILFVFITSLTASSMIIASRRLGVTRRMLGTPTSTATIVGGITLGHFLMALFQALYIVVLGIAVFGVNFGNPLAAIALISLFVLVGTSFAVLAGTVFRTAEQASAIGAPVGIAMGMLAGCMWPRFVMPVPMQRIGQLFPHSWAMDGFIKLIARGGTIVDIAPQLAVLAAFVVVLLPLATWRLRRSIVAAS